MKLLALVLGSLPLALGACQRPAPAAEAAAIKRVLEKESATWRAGDVAGHAACWLVRPYGRIIISTAEGKTFEVPPARMLAASPGMGQGGRAVNSNYHVEVAGPTAWVSHDEVSTARDGQRTYSYEFRLLEKAGRDWKLVGQSIHVYKP